MSKALIFGVNGQDGILLSRLLRERHINVIGVSRSAGDVRGDIADYDFVKAMIKGHSPDYIFHFAANSSTHHDTLFDNHRAISTGTLNILESVRQHCSEAKVFLSGSAMQFKNEGIPIDELHPFEASSPYSIARIQSVYAGRYYRSTFNLAIYCGFLFNHDSALRSDRHINQKVVRAVQRIASGSDEKLRVGDISVKKEFNYAGDIVDAIWLMVNQDEVFEAVIGSGKAYSIEEWIECCFKKINKDWKDYVVLNQGYKAEYKNLVSNPALLHSIGWSPKVDFEGLADIMLSTV